MPETYWYEPDPSVLGGAFFVMARVDGLVPPDVLPYTFGDNWVFDATDDASAHDPGVGGRAMAGIHSITPADHDLAFLELDQPGATALERQPQPLEGLPRVGGRGRPVRPARRLLRLADRQPARRTPGADALSWGDGRIGNMMFRDNQVVAVLDWEMAAVAPPEVDLGWMCYLHLFFQDLAVDLGAPGLPDMFRPADVRATYAAASGQRTGGPHAGTSPIAAMRHGVIMRRVTERSIYFGEAERPDDIDDLIIHRATLRRHARRLLLGGRRPLSRGDAVSGRGDRSV